MTGCVTGVILVLVGLEVVVVLFAGFNAVDDVVDTEEVGIIDTLL